MKNEYNSEAKERRKNLVLAVLAAVVFLIASSLEYRWDIAEPAFVEVKQVVNR